MGGLRVTGRSRVAVIGLDCGTPGLLFEQFADDMPTLTKLRERSLWGPLRSIVPPITVPAWSCMMAGRTPGELGIYGFRNRMDRSYDGLGIATSRAVKVPRLWDRLTAAGRDSVVVSVPGTYPPSAIRGTMVSCFLAPSTDSRYTSPASVSDELADLTGGYVLDVADFRTEDKARVAQQVFDMTEQRFTVAKHFAGTRDWDLFAFVDMGPDRLHHGFWAACDPEHPRYEPGNPHENLFRDYYRGVDRHLAEFLEVLDDDVAVLLVSDHGGQPMLGGFCLNEWLRERGYLVLNKEPTGPTPIAQCDIDWSRTIAWGDGGYYGRLFLNVAGREPNGVIAPGSYDAVRERLVRELEELTDHEGLPMGNRALLPEDEYPEVNGIAPDLIVYFGDLRWRAAGTLGLGTGLYTFTNDTGPDDANHAQYGVFALSGDGLDVGYREDLSLLDVAPTLQSLLGLPPVATQRGRILT